MAKIYKATDLITVNVGDLTIKLSPLTFEQKMEIQEAVMKGDTQSTMRAASLAVKCSVKSIEGLETSDGSEYKLEFTNGLISDSCWDDLQSIEETQTLILICLNLIKGIPSEFVDPNTGTPLQGVSLIKDKSKVKKK